jgi:hypothetical protein
MMLKNSLVCLLILCGIVGCVSNRITKNYDFTSPVIEIEHKDLTVVALLIGTFSSGEKVDRYNVSIKSNPYELLVQVSAISFFYKSVTITKLRIEDESGKQIIIPNGSKLLKSNFVDAPAGYVASLSIKGLELPHETHRLYLDIAVQTKANSRENLNVEFLLTPQYNEEKSNDTWSGDKKN